MAITETDIKFLASARMADTADGGGRMSPNVVQSGVNNNVFPDVDDSARVYGQVSLRELFGGVLTNDTDAYLGARVIIDKPAADDAVHGVIFAAQGPFELRAAAQSRMEAYLASGAPYMGLLYGPHIEGMRVVSILQRAERELPAIGEVLLLVKDGGLPTEVSQYLRITSVASESFTFTDSAGDYTRAVVTCGISDPLATDFSGFEATRTDSDISYAGKARLFGTVVADAAEYYGIRPLAVAASVNDYNIQADSAYSPLLPSAQVETPITDTSAAGFVVTALPVGELFTLSGTYTLTTAQSLHIGSAVEPGSLVIAPAGWTTPLTDSGAGSLMYGSSPVGAVDHANGIVSLSDAAYAFTGTAATITCRMAATPSAALRSHGIHVTAENRGLNWVTTLPTVPARGTLVVSYRAGGKWYVLRDGGGGGLSGAIAGTGAGSINFTTGSVVATLGALPDVGSDIIYQWAEQSAAMSATAASLADPARLHWQYTHSAATVMASVMTISWNDGTARTATCVNGVFTGDGVGTVAGNQVVRFSPNVLPAAGTVFTLNANLRMPTEYAASNIKSGSVGETVSPGSFVATGISFAVDFATSGAYNGADVYITGSSLPGATLSWLSGRHIAGTLTGRSIRDDGAGNLFITWDGGWVGASAPAVGRINVGTINYTTGAWSLFNNVTLGDSDPGPTIGLFKDQGTALVPWTAVPLAHRTGTFSSVAQAATVSYQGATGTAQAITYTPTSYSLALQSVPAGKALRAVAFTVGAVRYAQDVVLPTQLQRDISPVTGVGTAAGTVDLTSGRLYITSWPDGVSPSPTAFAAALLSSDDAASDGNSYLSDRLVFRTPIAPLRPGSFSVQGTMGSGAEFNVTADANGKILSATVAGSIDYQTGVCTLHFRETNPDLIASAPTFTLPAWLATLTGLSSVLVCVGGVRTSTVRYNAVGYSYLPLDADILGLDPVRLPTDGRVPVFKAGRVVVVHNTQTLGPMTVSNGQTVDCGRERLARLTVRESTGTEATSGFTRNLNAGTITFTNVAGLAQPITLEHRVEDEALCAEVQITGDMRLTRPLTHDYPTTGSYVSSALMWGTLQAAAQDAFSQETWTNVWSDTRIGDPLLAQYDDTNYPLVVTNAGAITERWACIFTSNTAFNLVGENLGLIATGSTAAVLSPVNPATGVPYVTVYPAGWGGGYVAGNVVRFNTVGAVRPFWVARTVLQSPAAPPGSDQFVLALRGGIDQ